MIRHQHPTKLPENFNVVIEVWIKGDRNEDKSGFVVEVFLGYRNSLYKNRQELF